ncbi:MFS transporter [Candidatus Pacearchaeota archaeon]|jgi:MFS family permease|nr:MFS transporter [Candidatus Pacearchaeota archaeon]
MKKKGSGFKNIFLLGGASLFNDVGSEMITPILPFYITQLGGAGLAVGLISGLREGLASLFKLFGGWFSDKMGKRMPFIFFGYFVSIIFRFLLSTINLWQYLIAFISFERFGKLRDAPRDALITQSTHHRGRGFGIHQMLDTTGGIIGTILVIFLFWKLQLGIKTIIIIAAGISAFSIIPLFFVREPKFKSTKISLLKGIHKLDKHLKYLIFVISFFTLGNFGLYLFLLLRAREISGNIVVPLVIYAVFNLVSAIFLVPFGNLSDKIGRKKVLLSGYILFFIISLGFIYVDSLFYLIILFALYGLVFAITQANQKAFVSDISGELKGTAFGFYSFVTGIVNILGGLIAGILWDISYSVMFTYISVIAFISIILLIFVKKR